MAGSYTTSEGQLVTLAIENYYSRKQLIEDGGCYAELAYSIDEQPISYFEYSQLNEEDRKRLFVNLNDTLIPSIFTFGVTKSCSITDSSS